MKKLDRLSMQLLRAASYGAMLATCVISSSAAADPEAYKSGFSLFNPTPQGLMREFEPDRPDLTDSPFTVDAGHFQFEADVTNYTLSRPGRDRAITETFLFGSTEVRIGITNNAEFDILIQPAKAIATHYSAPGSDNWDFGTDTIELGARFNIFGNDTFDRPGSIATGIKPFIEIPTGSEVSGNFVEGGLAIPFAIKLARKFEAELMTEYDVIKSDQQAGYHIEFFNSGSLTYQWTEALSIYAEGAALLNSDEGPGTIVIVGTGVLMELSANASIDFAANFGVTEGADRANLVVGFARRF